MNARKAKHGGLLTFIFTLISLVYVFPIVLVVINSFKKDVYKRQIRTRARTAPLTAITEATAAKRTITNLQ